MLMKEGSTGRISEKFIDCKNRLIIRMKILRRIGCRGGCRLRCLGTVRSRRLFRIFEEEREYLIKQMLEMKSDSKETKVERLMLDYLKESNHSMKKEIL